MIADEKKRSVASMEKPPRWSRRAFGRFTAMITAAVAIWKPRVMSRKSDVSVIEADHWEPVTHRRGVARYAPTGVEIANSKGSK